MNAQCISSLFFSKPSTLSRRYGKPILKTEPLQLARSGERLGRRRQKENSVTLTIRDRAFILQVGLVVIAICTIVSCLLPAGAANSTAGYTIVSATGTPATAWCPQGTELLGGGGKGTEKNTYTTSGVNSYPETRPYGQSSGWTYYVRYSGYNILETTAYAICAKL